MQLGQTTLYSVDLVFDDNANLQIKLALMCKGSFELNILYQAINFIIKSIMLNIEYYDEK